jgi:hypothetical protein
MELPLQLIVRKAVSAVTQATWSLQHILGLMYQGVTAVKSTRFSTAADKRCAREDSMDWHFQIWLLCLFIFMVLLFEAVLIRVYLLLAYSPALVFFSITTRVINTVVNLRPGVAFPGFGVFDESCKCCMVDTSVMIALLVWGCCHTRRGHLLVS